MRIRDTPGLVGVPLRLGDDHLAESAALECGADREHAEVGVVAAVFELTAGDDGAVPRHGQDAAVRRLDDGEHALRVRPLTFEEVRLRGPAGPAGVPGEADSISATRASASASVASRKVSPVAAAVFMEQFLRNLWRGSGTAERNAPALEAEVWVQCMY